MRPKERSDKGIGGTVLSESPIRKNTGTCVKEARLSGKRRRGQAGTAAEPKLCIDLLSDSCAGKGGPTGKSEGFASLNGFIQFGLLRASFAKAISSGDREPKCSIVF